MDDHNVWVAVEIAGCKLSKKHSGNVVEVLYSFWKIYPARFHGPDRLNGRDAPPR